MLEFQSWFNKTPEEMYGYGNKQDQTNKDPYENNPIEYLKSEELLNNMQRFGSIGSKEPYRANSSVLEFGEGLGKFLISVSPLGSYKIILRRYIKTLKGSPAPICKRVYPLVNDYKHLSGINDETKLAEYIYDNIKSIDDKNLDYCKNEFSKEEFLKLVIKLAEKVRQNHPIVMVFDEVVRIDDYNYIVSMIYKAGGVELPMGRRGLQFQIHMQYIPSLGLIRSWGNEVSTTKKITTWDIQPSEWDEVFSTSQDPKEIIENIIRILSTY